MNYRNGLCSSLTTCRIWFSRAACENLTHFLNSLIRDAWCTSSIFLLYAPSVQKLLKPSLMLLPLGGGLLYMWWNLHWAKTMDFVSTVWVFSWSESILEKCCLMWIIQNERGRTKQEFKLESIWYQNIKTRSLYLLSEQIIFKLWEKVLHLSFLNTSFSHIYWLEFSV